MNTSQFFYRCATFTRENGSVALADIHNPKQTSELEEWFGVVISLADGLHTIQELVDYMANQYEASPENLDETISSVIERLVDGKMIQLSDNKVELPYYLASPIEVLDLDKAKKLMVQDGYVYH